MSDGTSWFYFTDQASAGQAAAGITARGCCQCQAGHVEDDTIAAPAIGHLDDPERRWVLAIADADDDSCTCLKIIEEHGGEFDTHESGEMPITPEMRQMLPFPN